MDACPMWTNQSAHAQRPPVAMQRRAPNDLSAFAACQLQTSSCGAFTFKGRDGAGCCCSWRTRPASGSLPRPAESDRFAWWVHPGALGSRTSGCAQILDKEALAYTRKQVANKRQTTAGLFRAPSGCSEGLPSHLQRHGRGNTRYKQRADNLLRLATHLLVQTSQRSILPAFSPRGYGECPSRTSGLSS